MDNRVNVRYTFLMLRDDHYLEEIVSLTVFDVNGLKRCIKTFVYIGGIREKHHAHFVGVTSFCHCSYRLISTQSEDETHKQLHVCSVV